MEKNIPVPYYLSRQITQAATRDRMRVRGVLERERKKKWEEIQESEYVPLVFNGCQDHICHLASMEFEKSLIHRSLCWNKNNQIEGKGHLSSVALCPCCV